MSFWASGARGGSVRWSLAGMGPPGLAQVTVSPGGHAALPLGGFAMLEAGGRGREGGAVCSQKARYMPQGPVSLTWLLKCSLRSHSCLES